MPAGLLHFLRLLYDIERWQYLLMSEKCTVDCKKLGNFLWEIFWALPKGVSSHADYYSVMRIGGHWVQFSLRVFKLKIKGVFNHYWCHENDHNFPSNYWTFVWCPYCGINWWPFVVLPIKVHKSLRLLENIVSLIKALYEGRLIG